MPASPDRERIIIEWRESVTKFADAVKRLAECTGEGDGFLDQFHITEIAPGSTVKPHASFWNIAAPTTTADGRQRAGNLSAPTPVFARFPPSPPGAGFGAL